MSDDAATPDTAPPPRHTLGVFASATVPGDPEWARALSQAGTLFGKGKARIVCLAEDGVYCRPLVTAACGAGGQVLILSDGSVELKGLAKDVKVEVIGDAEARWQRMSDLSDALVGFPASLPAVRALFGTWVLAGGGSSGKPVALLNRNRAYEVVRGYTMDVLAHSLATADRLLFFADTADELWSKLQKALTAADAV